MNIKNIFPTDQRAVQVAGQYRTNWLTGLFGFGGTTSKAGAEVNLTTAQIHTAVMSCWRVLSEGVAQLPLHLMIREVKDGKVNKKRAHEHPLYDVFNLQPYKDEKTTSFNWIEAMMINLVSRGNGFSQILRNQRGDIVGFVPLLTDSMTIYRSDDGQVGYVYSHQKLGRVWLNRDEVLHIVGMSYDGVHGMSPIEYSKNAIGLSIALEEHGSSLFSRGANPSGVFEKDGPLSDIAFNRLRDDLIDKYVGLANSNKPLLLEEGLRFKQISLSNNDSQFLESRKFQKAEIASIYRVPLHLLNDLDGATFSNIEQQSLEFSIFTLTPWIKRFEQAFNIALKSVDGSLYVKFNMDAMIRGDITSRYEANGAAIRDGWKTRNEVREQENLNPIDGLDDPILPLNMGKGDGNAKE